MKTNDISLYFKYHVNKDDERLGLFNRINEKHNIQNALYPGSFAHITPIFVFPVVVFNDVYKKLKKFYESEDLKNYIKKRKIYPYEATYSYICANFKNPLPIKNKKFDSLISQYAGFVSFYCKSYLKKGGILVVNNSHGDASMASILPDYDFIGVIIKRGNKYFYSTQYLEEYFIPKKEIIITRKYLEEHQRGIGYKKTASNYIFKKIK